LVVLRAESYEEDEMAFVITKPQPRFGHSVCKRCGRAIYRAPSKRNPDKTITTDERTGVYVLEEQPDGTVLAVWEGPSAGYAYHYNEDGMCASDEEAAEANDV
jgi:hypothetical protein